MKIKKKVNSGSILSPARLPLKTTRGILRLFPLFQSFYRLLRDLSHVTASGFSPVDVYVIYADK